MALDPKLVKALGFGIVGMVIGALISTTISGGPVAWIFGGFAVGALVGGMMF